MLHKSINSLLCAIALFCFLTTCTAQGNNALVLAYFTESHPGLYLASSVDGLKWCQMNKTPLLVPDATTNYCFRDPCVCQGPDGTFHMVWTAGFNNSFGYSSSKDLIHWEPQRKVTVMESEPACVNVWAPDIFYSDEDSLFYIMWASTVPGKHSFVAESENEKGLNHRIYFTTTRDFRTFSPSRMFFNPDFSVIDATVIRIARKRLMMVVKNENPNPPEKNLRVTFSRTMSEGFPTNVSAPITPNTEWAEGPSVIKFGRHFYLYYDVYSHGRLGVLRSRNCKRWTDVTEMSSFPSGARHGSVFVVPRELVESVAASL